MYQLCLLVLYLEFVIGEQYWQAGNTFTIYFAVSLTIYEIYYKLNLQRNDDSFTETIQINFISNFDCRIKKLYLFKINQYKFRLIIN